MYGMIPLMNWLWCKNLSIQFLNMKLWIAENFFWRIWVKIWRDPVP